MGITPTRRSERLGDKGPPSAGAHPCALGCGFIRHAKSKPVKHEITPSVFSTRFLNKELFSSFKKNKQLKTEFQRERNLQHPVEDSD